MIVIVMMMRPIFWETLESTDLLLYVNGQKVPSHLTQRAKPNQTLLSFLRTELRLTGSKLGCAEGGCGACTVMISKYDEHKQKIQHYAVNACLMPVCAADACHVTTVEGVGNVSDSKMHPIQERMVDLHGSQCGYCTPGIIVSMYALFASGNHSIKDVEEHLDGNLCRCTGYRPIWDSIKSLCANEDGNVDKNNKNNHDSSDVVTGPCGESCRTCPERDACHMPCNEQDKQKQLHETSCCSSSTSDKCSSLPKLHPSFLQQPDQMFPKELLTYKEESLLLISDHSTWFKPTSLSNLLELKAQFPEAKIVVGNTEVGIETKFKNAVYPRYISASSVPELHYIESTPNQLKIGACTPLSTIQHYCEEIVHNNSNTNVSNTKIEFAIWHMLRWFASTQIRNVASLSGNLVNASPISDMNPLLASMGAHVEIISSHSKHIRIVPVKDFFLSYRKVDLQSNEVLTSIVIPRLNMNMNKWTYVLPFKQARRREDDISIVTSGILVELEPKDNLYFEIKHASLAFGGMAPTTIMAPQTQAFLVGKEFCQETFVQARQLLGQELQLPENVPGGQPEYRRALASSFLYKFYLAISMQLELDISNDADDVSNLPPPPKINQEERSGATSFLTSLKPSIRGTQTHPAPLLTEGVEDIKFQNVDTNQMPKPKPTTGEAGKSHTHQSGKYHCTGEAVYVDDIPEPENMLHSALILSNRSCGSLLSVDKTKALEMKGVVGVYTYSDLKDIGGKNELGAIFKDEEVFATREIRHYGMVIGIVVAETLEVAQLAARSVTQIYDESDKTEPIITIEEAIAAQSFYEASRHVIESGNVNKVLASSDKDQNIVVEGTMQVGGQEHFYLETMCSLIVPSEANQGLTVYSSTQALDKTQVCCASATGLPMHRVIVKTKRMGGGFGGKETRTVFAASAAAVAAKITKRPVKITLDRNVDMSITGSRHSFLAKYRASMNLNLNLMNEHEHEQFTLGALDIQLYNNGGGSFDLSGPVMDRALFHVDGVYKWKAFRAEGVVCKTHQPPHTAFRGFGGPQGIAICEHILDHLASEANVSPETLRTSNLYQEGDYTPFGLQILPNTWNIPKAWDQMVESADYTQRKEAVQVFNSQNKLKKRGIVILPTKFGIAVSKSDTKHLDYFLCFFLYISYMLNFYNCNFIVHCQIHESRRSSCTCLHRWYRPRHSWRNRNGTGPSYKSMSNCRTSLWYTAIRCTH